MNNSINDLEISGVSVVIGSYNRKNFLKKTIETVRKELGSCLFPSEIIIIDGGSSDGTLFWLLKQKDIITIVQHNRGFWQGHPIEQRSWGYFMNLGFKAAKGKYICMISDDCLVIPGAIKKGYALFEEKVNNNENVGGIAFLFRDWPDMEKYYYQTFWDHVNINHGLYLRKALQEVNYADESTYRFYKGDIDLAHKLLYNDFSIIISENSFIEHFGHANMQIRKQNMKVEDEDSKRLIEKWSPFFKFIKDNPYEQKIHHEVMYDDEYKTVNYWLTLAEYKHFKVRRFFVDHTPITLKRVLSPIRKMCSVEILTKVARKK